MPFESAHLGRHNPPLKGSTSSPVQFRLGGHQSWDCSHQSTLNSGVPTNPLVKRSKKVSVFMKEPSFLKNPGNVALDTR
ncbi:hypothetical protein FNV43_RR14807 [Rhamnella rubrinervis]|uniref:Uncharacterized protein n=1 Tax=Rhamnella rubrinervis TaxID=2594499 RepID=A0A8K0MG55_9ROSA|nr:hypothetical protein FNV43_RR14807 [Rhamnella rubrinervis]